MKIDLYDWYGDDYYEVQPIAADMYVSVYSADTCEFECAPSGGFTGTGDGNCTTFYLEATYDSTVWTMW